MAETAATADAPAAVTETAAQTTAPKTTPGGVDKSETVYAKANADGTVTETTVEAVLKARDGATIPDVAALRDIINKEGDEEYTTGADNALTWQNSGSAITYEGKSDAALPVTTRVTYYLNGVETAPDDLAGQSGRVRIRFDYTNHTRETVTVDGQEYTVSVPFTAITAVILDGDKFSNIEADNGKVMELDGQTAVLGTVTPGAGRRHARTARWCAGVQRQEQRRPFRRLWQRPAQCSAPPESRPAGRQELPNLLRPPRQQHRQRKIHRRNS